MKICICISRANDSTGYRIASSIKERFLDETVGVCVGVDDLLNELKRPITRPDAVVLHSSTEEELRSIVLNRQYLLDRFIILVIPDERQSVVRLGHQLRPRYMTTEKGDTGSILAVLQKHFENQRNGERGVTKSR